MNKFSISTRTSASALPVLHHWQAFRVNPMKPCFIPMAGPRFWIFIGLLNNTEKITRTAEVVSWDPVAPSVRDATGACYGLGLQAGFTPAMQSWYQRQANLVAAGAWDYTAEMLMFLNQHALDESAASTKFQCGAVA